MTGRKITRESPVVATRHGGGAFSGKDATKVDVQPLMQLATLPELALQQVWLRGRSSIGLCYRGGAACFLLSDTFGTGTVAGTSLKKTARQILRLQELSNAGSQALIYRQTAAYGHMGRTDIDLHGNVWIKGRCIKRSCEIKLRW